MELNNNQNQKSFFSDRSVIILLLSILSVVGIYYYELGTCAAYNIPFVFIRINPLNFSDLFVLFLAVITGLSTMLTLLESIFLSKRNLFFKISIPVSIIIYIVYFIYNNRFDLGFINIKYELFQPEIALLLFSVIAFLYLLSIIISPFEYIKFKKKYSRFTIYKLTRSSLVNIAIILAIIPTLCISMFLAGYRNAYIHMDILSEYGDKELIKIYDDTNIFVQFITKDSFNIYIERGTPFIDTIEYSIK